MRKGIFFTIIFLVLFACDEEHPKPENFLEYQYPSYQYLNGAVLSVLNESIKSGSLGDIHSLVIVRNDKIIFENYYSNFKRSDLHPIGESTQSIVSALVGAALHENDKLSLDTAIINLLPNYSVYFNDVPQKDHITIRHLLSNTSGFWWDESTNPFGSGDNDAYEMSQSDDWIANVLSTPMIQEPGAVFNLNSGLGVLMAPIMENLTGMELEAYAKARLFDPLDITDWNWERISGDFVNASWGLYLRPIDLAKIGYLYLKGGIWNNQVIFDENWQIRSTRFRVAVSSYYGYGFSWWRFSNTADVVYSLKENDVFFSWGSGGQFLFVIPHLDMVIVMTAGNYSSNENIAIPILKDYIFPAIFDRFQ